MSQRRIALCVFEGVQSLDLVGPLEVFAGANELLRGGASGATAPALRGGASGATAPALRGGASLAYETRVVGKSKRALRTSSGLSLVPEGALDRMHGAIDTLIVPGGQGTRAAVRDRALLRGVERLAKRARRVVSVCTGAFVLAELGLLDGRRATTHWRYCDLMATTYPAVRVESEPIFVRDGNVYTSAGVTAGIDLALALVEEDLGQKVALTIARELVLFLRRPGNQAQFSAQLATQAADREPLREVQRFIAEHPGRDLSTDNLARRANMSVRHFARCFAAEVGMTPARYVEQVRLEAARRRLTESSDGVERVAAVCGFGTSESLRRAFLRRLSVTPTDYRTRFRTAH